MRRVVSVLLACTFLLALAAPVAADATPIDERRVRENIPLEFTTFVVGSDIGCSGFDVLGEDIEGRATYVFITEDRHGNILERLVFHTQTRYTNVTTGASFVRRFDSVQNFTTRPDGTFRVVTRNDGLFTGGDSVALPDPGLFLIEHGRVINEYAADGSVISEVVVEADEIIDVCALLQ